MLVQENFSKTKNKTGQCFPVKSKVTCKNWAHLDEEKKIGLNSHSRASCTQPFNYSKANPKETSFALSYLCETCSRNRDVPVFFSVPFAPKSVYFILYLVNKLIYWGALNLYNVAITLMVHLNSLNFAWPSFSKFPERMFGSFEQVCNFVKSAKTSRKVVDWKLNQVWIGSNFCPTSIWLFLTFSLFSKKLDSVETFSSNFCLTFAQHSFWVKLIIQNCLNGPLITPLVTVVTSYRIIWWSCCWLATWLGSVK